MFTISYKRNGAWLWKKLTVKGDSPDNISHGSHLLFILPDESHVLIPKDGTEFRFSKERHFAILAQMEKQAGQKLPVG